MSKIVGFKDEITIEYNLFDLPSSQHRAGLGGLIFYLSSMETRNLTPRPKLEWINDFKAKVTMSYDSLKTVIDDLFASTMIEIPLKTIKDVKGQKIPPKRTEETVEIIQTKKGPQEKIVKKYIYDMCQPKGDFLKAFYQDSDGLWLKLWRDMIWSIIRGINTTQGIYTANDKTSETEEIWSALQKVAYGQNVAKKPKELTSSLFIGAESSHADNIDFLETPQDKFLLNFWPLVTLTFVPRVFEVKKGNDKDDSQKNDKAQKDDKSPNKKAFVLVIPEIFNLKSFVEDIQQVFRTLPAEKAGYRPKHAVIDLIEEGGLEFLYYFAKQKALRTGNASVKSADIYYAEKDGNRIKYYATASVKLDKNIYDDYCIIRDSFSNPVYKKVCLKNLIQGNPWYMGFDEVFHTYPACVFVQSDATPKNVRFFGADAKEKFKSINKALELKKGVSNMTQKDIDASIDRRIEKIVKTYLYTKAETRSNVKPADFQNPDYREALEKIGNDTLLAMRNRDEQDFTNYFIEKLCSMPQFIPEKEMPLLQEVLFKDWMRAKNIAMLAVSAYSFTFKSTNE